MNNNKDKKNKGKIGQKLYRQLTHEYTSLLVKSMSAKLKRDEQNWILFASECKFDGENLERILNNHDLSTYGGNQIARERDVKMIWARILAPEHSLLDVLLTDLDEFLVRQVPREASPAVLSLITQKYLDLHPPKKETLRVLWRTGVEARPEDERLWEKLKSLTPDAEERREILEEGLERSFRYSFQNKTRGFCKPEQIQRWQKILTCHAFHYQSDISFLREKWMNDILAGDRPDRRWMGWWGLSLSGVATTEDEEILLEVLASRLKPLMQDKTEAESPTGGQAARKIPQTDLMVLNIMELEAMAQWRPNCPVRRRKALELWENNGKIPKGWGTYSKLNVYRMARFRLESEENLLAEVKIKEKVSVESVMRFICWWTPENPDIREQFLGICENVLDSCPPRESEREQVENILAACFRLDIPPPRLFPKLEKIFLKFPVTAWPTNLAPYLKGITNPTGLMSCDILPLLTSIRMANRFSYNLPEDIRPAIIQTGLELLRLANGLPEPPSAAWTRNALKDIAGATPDNWEPIRWGILESLSGQESNGKNGHQSSGKTCLSVIPEWLTLDDEGYFGSGTFMGKAGGLIQIIRFLRSGNYENDEPSSRGHGIQQALQTWLEQENFHIPQLEEFFPAVFLGNTMLSGGYRVNHFGEAYRIIREMESTSPTSKHEQSIIKCLKYEILTGNTRRVLQQMKNHGGDETPTVFRLLRTMLQYFPEQRDSPANVLESIVKKMLPSLTLQDMKKRRLPPINIPPHFVLPSPDLWGRRGSPGLQPQGEVAGEPSEKRMLMSPNR